jgi:hypothetical protein
MAVRHSGRWRRLACVVEDTGVMPSNEADQLKLKTNVVHIARTM